MGVPWLHANDVRLVYCGTELDGKVFLRANTRAILESRARISHTCPTYCNTTLRCTGNLGGGLARAAPDARIASGISVVADRRSVSYRRFGDAWIKRVESDRSLP